VPVARQDWTNSLFNRLAFQVALMGEGIARKRSSDEKAEKEPYGGIRGDGIVGRTEGRKDAGGTG
jgi:hypothetical protein